MGEVYGERRKEKNFRQKQVLTNFLMVSEINNKKKRGSLSRAFKLPVIPLLLILNFTFLIFI
jgi:hypothetical protein